MVNSTSVLLSTFMGFDFKMFDIPFITVYYNPSDYPNKYVARVFDLNTPTEFIIVKDTIREIRKSIPSRFIRLNRYQNDDPAIVEVWV